MHGERPGDPSPVRVSGRRRHRGRGAAAYVARRPGESGRGLGRQPVQGPRRRDGAPGVERPARGDRSDHPGPERGGSRGSAPAPSLPLLAHRPHRRHRQLHSRVPRLRHPSGAGHRRAPRDRRGSRSRQRHALYGGSGSGRANGIGTGPRPGRPRVRPVDNQSARASDRSARDLSLTGFHCGYTDRCSHLLFTALVVGRSHANASAATSADTDHHPPGPGPTRRPACSSEERWPSTSTEY